MSSLSLHPQDVVVLAKLLSYTDHRPSLARMAADLLLSASQVHAALNRLAIARLVLKDARNSRANMRAAEEFLVHGAKYMFPAVRGGVTRGMLTSYAAPPLNQQISSGSDLPPVWPFALGAAARLLEPLLDEVVFVGGCVTGLLITDPAVAGTRPTTDVEVITEVSCRVRLTPAEE